MIKDQYGRNCHSRQFLPLCFNIPPGGHYPPEGIPPKYVRGVKVWVLPAIPNNHSKHRAMSECPICLKTIPLGRLAQHEVIHNKKQWVYDDEIGSYVEKCDWHEKA